MYIEGLNPLESYPYGLVDSPVPFLPGNRGRDGNGNEYVFATTVSAGVIGSIFQLALGNAVGSILLTTAAALYNRQLGIGRLVFAANALGTGFWAQVQGATTVLSSAAVVVNVPVYSTATPGACDDTAAASNLLRGITFTTAPGAGGAFAAIVNYPTVGTIADTDNPA